MIFPLPAEAGTSIFFRRSATSSCISCPAYTIRLLVRVSGRNFTAMPREGPTLPAAGAASYRRRRAGRASLQVDRGQRLRGLGRDGVGQRVDPKDAGGPRVVDLADDRDDPVDIGARVDQQQRVGGCERGDHSVLGDQRRHQRDDLGALEVLQRNEPGDELRGPGVLPDAGVDRVLAGFPGGDDLDRVPLRDGGEPLRLQHGKEDVVRLVERHPAGGDDRDLSLHPLVEDEVLLRLLAHELDEDRELDVGEVHRQVHLGWRRGSRRRRGRRRRRGSRGRPGGGGRRRNRGRLDGVRRRRGSGVLHGGGGRRRRVRRGRGNGVLLAGRGGRGRRSRHGGRGSLVRRRRLGRVRGGPEGDQAGDQQDRNSHGILPDHRISYVSVVF